jgi:general nucleoside transport system permease protein
MDKSKPLSWLSGLWQPLAAVVVGLVIGALGIIAAGQPVVQAYSELLYGAFGNAANLGSTLARSAPIALCGLGAGIALKAGLFNLGGEGQIALGGLIGALAVLYLKLPPVLLIPAGLLAGALAGGLWALLPAWLEVRYRIALLLSSLLLNYVAVIAAGYLVSEPLRDRSGQAALAQTAMIPMAARFNMLIPGTRLHTGLFLVPVVAGVLLCFLYRTVMGYEWRMTGLSGRFAAYGGVVRRHVTLGAMLLSGAVAGLAGAIETLGIHHRYIDGNLTRPGYAWTGLMAALLADSHPVGVLVASVLLSAIQTGATGLERAMDVPLELSSVVQAAIILLASAKLVVRWRKKGATADV